MKKKRAIRRREIEVRLGVVSNLLHRLDVVERDLREVMRKVGMVGGVMDNGEAVDYMNQWFASRGFKSVTNGVKGRKVPRGTILGETVNYNNRIKRK